MLKIAELACVFLFYPDLLVGKISYHFENDSVILPCQQLSDDPIWYGPPGLKTYAIGVTVNKLLANSDRISIMHSNGSSQYNLRIRYFSVNDVGQYKCFRSSTMKDRQEIFFNLSKAKAPSNLTIEKEDLKQTVYGYWNKLFDLTCTIIQGIPTGKLMWIANTVTLVESGKSSVVHSFKPQKKDHLKQFTCETKNNITDFRLQRSVQFFVYMPPSVWIHPDHNLVIVHEGDDLTIYCNYSSNSNITYLKWNRLLTMKSQLWTSQYSPDLFIRNIQRGHAGQYVCTVANMAGNGSDSITVKVNSPLKSPQNIMAVAFSDKIVVKWTSDLEIGSQETFVVEYRKLVESAWSQVSVEDRYTAVINGLVADTVYLVRVYCRTASRKSDRTDNLIVKTEKQHFTGFVLPLEFAVILGGVLLIPYLFFCGMKVFKNRPNFRRNNQRVHHEHRHAETSVQPAHYDEIDSMYYNPITEAISRQNIRSNTQLMPSTSNANFGIGQTDNSSSEIITPSISHQVDKSSQENASQGSSSDESYLVPCRNYIDFDIKDIPENQHLEINVDEPEIPKDESSVSSDNSETNIKIFRKYESLKGSNVNEHCYKNCNDIDV